MGKSQEKRRKKLKYTSTKSNSQGNGLRAEAVGHLHDIHGRQPAEEHLISSVVEGAYRSPEKYDNRKNSLFLSMSEPLNLGTLRLLRGYDEEGSASRGARDKSSISAIQHQSCEGPRWSNRSDVALYVDQQC